MLNKMSSVFKNWRQESDLQSSVNTVPCLVYSVADSNG